MKWYLSIIEYELEKRWCPGLEILAPPRPRDCQILGPPLTETFVYRAKNKDEMKAHFDSILTIKTRLLYIYMLQGICKIRVIVITLIFLG